MFKKGDGINHQQGLAAILDKTSLALVKNHGQTSGHSFSNYILVDSTGQFIGMDLGDNAPRGIHLHNLTSSTINSNIVYGFKTKHMTFAAGSAGATYDKYKEISDANTTFYKWSNDNEV